MPEPPVNFSYNVVTGMLSWESIAGAILYLIEATPVNQEVWTPVYQGPNTTAPFNRPQGTYLVRGQTKTSSDWGKPGKPKIIDVP